MRSGVIKIFIRLRISTAGKSKHSQNITLPEVPLPAREYQDQRLPNTRFLGPTVDNADGISVGSACFAGSSS